MKIKKKLKKIKFITLLLGYFNDRMGKKFHSIYILERKKK